MASYKMLFGISAVMIIMITETSGITEYYSEPELYNEHSKYGFEYDIKDKHTGDIKSQHETRDKDFVKGYYTLEQPDGKKRIVVYTSDHNSGFNAAVHYEGHNHPDIIIPSQKYEIEPVAEIKYSTPQIKYELPKYKSFVSTKVSTPHFYYKFKY